MNGKEFLGKGLKFPLQVDPTTGKIAMSEQEDDIREAIGIILRTGNGERIMRPGFGADVMRYAFAPVDSTMKNDLAHTLRLTLLEQEPRIKDVTVQCEESDKLTGALIINVDYVVRSTNNRFNHVYPFYTTEGSEGGGAE